MATIITKQETARRCGFRNPGGLYLVCDSVGKYCFKLPIALTVCPHCGEGIKQTRGFTWITNKIVNEAPCKSNCNGDGKSDCPFDDTTIETFGLLWVGEKFYTNAIDFTNEARTRGISKRIAQIPREFKIGKTWILLAHPNAVQRIEGDQAYFEPGIFHAFKPTRIEYILTGNETADELESLEKRGLTLIDLKKVETVQTSLINE
jgi:hypothetical protein